MKQVGGTYRTKHLHIGVLVPRLRIQPDSATVVVDQTGAVLLEQTNHRRTSGLRDVENFVAALRWTKQLTPPFNQTVRGAVSGLLRAAKNQNHMCCVEVRSA